VLVVDRSPPAPLVVEVPAGLSPPHACIPSPQAASPRTMPTERLEFLWFKATDIRNFRQRG
jgi:hypothetical protein